MCVWIKPGNIWERNFFTIKINRSPSGSCGIISNEHELASRSISVMLSLEQIHLPSLCTPCTHHCLRSPLRLGPHLLNREITVPLNVHHVHVQNPNSQR